jgi:hypothetical protein
LRSVIRKPAPEYRYGYGCTETEACGVDNSWTGAVA